MPTVVASPETEQVADHPALRDAAGPAGDLRRHGPAVLRAAVGAAGHWV